MSSVSSPRAPKPAPAAQQIFHIPGLDPPEDLQQPKQPGPRMHDAASSEIPFWASDASRTLQNGNVLSVKDMRTSPEHNDRRLEAQTTQPPAAGTDRGPEPRLPFAFMDARRSPASAAPASRWESLYEQTRQAPRNEAENGTYHGFQAKPTHDRRLSESVRPSANQHGDTSQASVPAHRRNMSIPARVTSPVSFLRRSRSPMVSDSERRATMGYTNPLKTNLRPATERNGSPSSGSQSAVEAPQGQRADHPPPGSWQGAQHRNSQSTSSRTFTPPPPSYRQSPPVPYPPPVSGSTSGPAYQHQSAYTTGPSYQHAQPPPPPGAYSGPYQGPPPSGPTHQYQAPPSSSAPQYDHRTANPFLPLQPQHEQQIYSGGPPPYQPPPQPLGFFSAPPPGPPPPSTAVFSPRFTHYPPPSSLGGQYTSGQMPPSPRSAGPPPLQDGSAGAHGRNDGWAKRR